LRLALFALVVSAVLFPSAPVAAQGNASCWEEAATTAFAAGYDQQQAGNTSAALQSYRRCLDIEPGCLACNYEIGWSYWVQKKWPEVVRSWEAVLAIDANHADTLKWLPKAKDKAGDRRVAAGAPAPVRQAEPTTRRPSLRPHQKGAVQPTEVKVTDAEGLAGLRSCKEAKRSLRNPPSKPGGRTRSRRSPKPDPTSMRRVQQQSIPRLPGNDLSALRPQGLEGPRAALDKIRDVFSKGNAGERVRISVYGASHTSSDRFTGRLREVLQKRWGDGGKGHVLPGPLYKWYGGRHISTCWSDGWLSDWQGKANAHRDGLLGHAGMSVSSSHPEEFGWLQTPSRGKTARGVSFFDVYTLGEPGAGTLEVWVDGGKRHRIRTERDQTELIRTRFSVPDGAHRITVSPVGDGMVRIFGVSLERDPNGGGAIVDAMGVRGMEARTWLSWEPSLFSPGIRSLDPDLVVLAYGTNEAADQSYDMNTYRADLRQVLSTLRRGAGEDVACILAGPSDRGWNFDDGTFAIWDRTAPVAQVQREVAGEFGCAFWDWQEAMGGPGSMIAWTHRDPPLGSKDLIHHSAAGYVEIANRFLAAIDALR